MKIGWINRFNNFVTPLLKLISDKDVQLREGVKDVPAAIY
jgi:hypothetical protein